ncbi:NAD(P)-dependent oxidoreductase [Pelomonas sp. KK5]|uniref:NAD-dependent epimerase/dehydratase family protein n=1 Tax=Pelomonas sp. KK5 TaxID=1855730 RepID=UPI00097C7814|nr:NAD-dependent epimerase/dehydratase family protein [Pelomonas sp. KK5]
MSTVLITGGAGFIGSHLARTLQANGMKIRILDTLAPQIHGDIPKGLDWLAAPGIEFMRGSVTDRADVERALSGVDYLVHLAAETGTGQSMYQIARYNEVNSQGTALLFDVLANAPTRTIRRVVLASSRSIYGEGAYECDAVCNATSGIDRHYPNTRLPEQLARHQWDPICPHCGKPLRMVPTREGDKISPASIYAATKYAQEDLVRIGCESLGMDYAILRLQNVYGEGQSLNNPYTGILSIFSTRVRRDLQLTAFEDGLESRDFVHVSDVAQAFFLAITKDGSVNKTINVGSGAATSVLEVARQLSESLGRQPDIRVTAEYRVGDIRHNVADISILRDTLGYEPQVSLQSGLRRFCDWVLTQPLPQDKLAQANAELKARNLMG